MQHLENTGKSLAAIFLLGLVLNSSMQDESGFAEKSNMIMIREITISKAGGNRTM